VESINLPGLLCVGGIIVLFVIPSWIWIEYTERQNARERDAARAAGRHQPVTIQPFVNLGVCMGSGACVSACPESVLKVIDGQAIAVNMSACVGHGACVTACPVNAIELVFGSEDRGIAIPKVNAEFETNVPGLFVAGELGGMGLIANAADQGVRAMQYAHRGLKKREGSFDVAIVGAGPAGLAAALSAMERGLSYVLLEQGDVGGAVLHFPRKKLVFTRPLTLPIYGTVDMPSMVKEQLVDLFRDVVDKCGVEVSTQERVDAIEPRRDGFSLTTSKRTLDAQRVILALGRRGTPRKLKVPGEDSEKVAYSLLEPEHYTYEHLLVVGGGDSAVEAACTLAEQEGNHVTLSYRSKQINRPKPQNIQRLREAVDAGSVRLLLESNVVEIGEDRVILEQHQEQIVLPNDYTFVFAGGILPTDFLTKAGVKIRKHFGKRVEDDDEAPQASRSVPELPETPLAPPPSPPPRPAASSGGEATLALPPVGASDETTRRLPVELIESLLDAEEATGDPATVLLPNADRALEPPPTAPARSDRAQQPPPTSPARSERTIRLPDAEPIGDMPTRILKGSDLRAVVARALGEQTTDISAVSPDRPSTETLPPQAFDPDTEPPPGEHTRKIPTSPDADEATDGSNGPRRPDAPGRPLGGIDQIAFGKLPAAVSPPDAEPLPFEAQIVQVERTLDLCGFAQALEETEALLRLAASMPAKARLNAEHRLALIQGRAHLGLHDPTEAAAAFERAASLAEQQHRDAPPSPALGWLGRTLLRAGDYERAEAVLNAALPETPDRGPVLCALHEVALRRGNPELAVKHGRQALTEAQKSDRRVDESEARASIAMGLVVQGNLKGALEQLVMADEGLISSDSPALRSEILARAIEVDLATGRFGQALYRLEVLLELATQHPLATRQPEAVVLLAETMRAVGLDDDAGSAALQAVALASHEGPVADPVRVRAARVLCDIGHHREAEAGLADVVDQPQGLVDDPVAQRLAVEARVAARSERRAGRERAVELAEQALERPPPSIALNAAQIRLDAATALLDAGQPARARATIKRGLKVVHGLAARGLKLDLMIALHAAQPDARVAEAVLKVAARILESLPEHAQDAFRRRPGLRRILADRG